MVDETTKRRVQERMKIFLETDPKYFAGWDSNGMTSEDNAIMMSMTRVVRHKMYQIGTTSRMRHHAGMYIIAFQPPKEPLSQMKVAVLIGAFKAAIQAGVEDARRKGNPPCETVVH